MTIVDGKIAGDNVNRLRFKVWDKATNAVIFDNQALDPLDAPAEQPIERGNIVIHEPKGKAK